VELSVLLGGGAPVLVSGVVCEQGFLSLWERECVIINPEELCVWEK
jgi:hypothetical protein